MELDYQRANMTFVKDIKAEIENDSRGSNSENQLETQNNGFCDSYNCDHSRYHSTSSGNDNELQMMDYENTRDQICRSLTNSNDPKLEKKRERNRIAATKCRMKKIEKIQTLEVRVEQLLKEKNSLITISQNLRQNIKNLESQINFHLRNGCQISTNLGSKDKDHEHRMTERNLPDYVCSTSTSR